MIFLRFSPLFERSTAKQLARSKRTNDGCFDSVSCPAVLGTECGLTLGIVAVSEFGVKLSDCASSENRKQMTEDVLLTISSLCTIRKFYTDSETATRRFRPRQGASRRSRSFPPVINGQPSGIRLGPYPRGVMYATVLAWHAAYNPHFRLQHRLFRPSLALLFTPRTPRPVRTGSPPCKRILARRVSRGRPNHHDRQSADLRLLGARR